MSVQLTGDNVVFAQRFLRLDGFYTGRIDGLWGRLTERAYRDFEGHSETLMRRTARFDHRSETNIRSICLPAQYFARNVIFVLSEHDITARILSGTRSYHEQNKLYQIGRGRFDKRSKVTYARGGRSRHNFGIAWDIGLFTTMGGYVRENEPYEQAGEIVAAEFGGQVEWGGHWSRKDRPHYQLKTGLSIVDLRTQFETGSLLLENHPKAA